MAGRFWGCIAAGLLLTSVSTVTAQYSGGTGEPNDPYQIATAADLIALGETPADYDKHFILTADIDLDPNLPGGKVFGRAVIAPDTNDVADWFQGTPFAGVFDGNGHIISHLTIKGGNCLGLFGYLEPAWDSRVVVRNLGVEDVDITGSGSMVGGLGGYICNGTIVRCYSTGAVAGGSCVGGLFGGEYLSDVTQCYSTSTVTGENRVGGLIGDIPDSSQVSGCHSTGAVTGKQDVGGLVGHHECGRLSRCFSTGAVVGDNSVVGLVGLDIFASISDCHSSGRVSGRDFVGGIVGASWGRHDTYVVTPLSYVGHSYSVGQVVGDTNVGGLMGGGEARFAGCFWDIQTSGQAASAGGTGKTTAETQMASTYLDAGWDFVGETTNGTEDIWWIDEGKDYPRLWWEFDEVETTGPYANPDIRDRSLVVQDISQADIFQGVEGECKLGWCEAHRGQTQLEESIPETLGDPNTPLYFIFAVHTCDDKLLDDPSRFRSGVANIRRIQNLLVEYGGMLSFQTSLRWAEMTQDSNDQTLRWLAGQGCEIGLHIHDEYVIPRYLGLDYQGVEPGLALAQQQPVDVWMGALGLIKGKVEAVSGVSPIQVFTGAPMCADRFYVGAKLGFQVTGDYKNPETRTTDERLAVLNPWRPAGSSDATEIATYDRNGPLIFVPSGVHPAHCQDSGGIPTPFTYASMDYITMLLRVNLSCVSPGKINVFSVVFHPWDFGESDFVLWKTWLDSVMCPLLDSHRVQWSTFEEVAQMYETWESTTVCK